MTRVIIVQLVIENYLCMYFGKTFVETDFVNASFVSIKMLLGDVPVTDAPVLFPSIRSLSE